MDGRNYSRVGVGMSKVYLCKGEYAKTPFYVEKQRLHLYSFEEVCFYIKENTCLLDKSIMTPAFIRFIGEECELENLERDLKTILHRKKSLSDYCECILRAEGNIDSEELESVLNSIAESETLDVFQKRKSNADYFVRKKKFFRAMLEYRRLLEETERTELVFRSEIIHNMGVIYANMLHFKEALNCFLESYEMNGRDESLIYYLVSAKMYLEEAKYQELLQTKPIYMEKKEEVDHLIETVESQWLASDLPGTPNNPVYDYNNTNQQNRIQNMEFTVSNWEEEYRLFIEE